MDPVEDTGPPLLSNSTTELLRDSSTFCSLTRILNHRLRQSKIHVTAKRHQSLPLLRGASNDNLSLRHAPVWQTVGPPLLPHPVDTGSACSWLELPSTFSSEQLIGHGVFASVLHVQKDHLNVILKVFKRGLTSDHAIIREAKMAACMASLGVGPTVMGLSFPTNCRSQPAIVMSYLDGACDFLTLLDIQRLNTYDVTDLLRQAARLLAVIHSQGFLHNDIKLANMLITANPLYRGNSHSDKSPPRGPSGCLTRDSRFRLYLIDFGHMTYLDGAYFQPPDEDKHGRMFSHLAPEILEGSESTVYSDIYSFGILMHETTEKMSDRIITEMLTPIIASCTSLIPEDRPPMELVTRHISSLVPSSPAKRRPTAAERKSRWDLSHSPSRSLREDNSHSPSRSLHGDHSPSRSPRGDHSPSRTLRGDHSPSRSFRGDKDSFPSRLSDISDAEEEEEEVDRYFFVDSLSSSRVFSEENPSKSANLEGDSHVPGKTRPTVCEIRDGPSSRQGTPSDPWYSGILNKSDEAWLTGDSKGTNVDNIQNNHRASNSTNISCSRTLGRDRTKIYSPCDKTVDDNVNEGSSDDFDEEVDSESETNEDS